jgi:hypothetical protein
LNRALLNAAVKQEIHMPPKNDPAHRHSEPAPRVRRKSAAKAKPRFEVPVEIESPVTPVEWVYRTKNVSKSPSVPAAHQVEDGATTDSFLAAGIGLFYVGAATVGFVVLAGVSLVAAPIGFAVGFLRAE